MWKETNEDSEYPQLVGVALVQEGGACNCLSY